MSLSSEALLDHIADFLKFISSAQSFWFTLNTSYDHGCHLASGFRLDLEDYEVVLPLVTPPLCRQLVVASPLVVLSLRRPLVVLSHQLVVASPLAVLSLSHPLVLSSRQLAPVASPLLVLLLRRPLVVLSRQLVVASPLAVLSLSHPLVLSSRQLAPFASPLLVLLLRRPLILSSRRLVVVSPQDVPPSHRLILSSCRPLAVSSSGRAALSSSRHASWLSHHLSSSSRCAALSSSHRAGWLLHCLSLRPPLVLSSCRCLVVPAYCCIIISHRPLVAPPSRPLIVLGTTTARGSRASGGTTTATGGPMKDGTTTATGSRVTGSMAARRR